MMKFKLIVTVCILALMVSVVQGQADIESGMVLNLPFKGNAQDESGHGNNGLVTGAVLSEDRFGNQNGAYYFDGADDYITVSHSESLNLGASSYTISMWVRMLAFDKHQALISKLLPADAYTQYKFFFHGKDYDIALADIGSSQVNRIDYCSGFAPEVNTWCHLVITVDKINKVIKFYVDGGLLGSQILTHVNNTNTNADLYIGAFGNLNNWFFKGWIDDVRIYREALRAVDVQELYLFEPAVVQEAAVETSATADIVVLNYIDSLYFENQLCIDNQCLAVLFSSSDSPAVLVKDIYNQVVAGITFFDNSWMPEKFQVFERNGQAWISVTATKNGQTEIQAKDIDDSSLHVINF